MKVPEGRWPMLIPPQSEVRSANNYMRSPLSNVSQEHSYELTGEGHFLRHPCSREVHISKGFGRAIKGVVLKELEQSSSGR